MFDVRLGLAALVAAGVFAVVPAGSATAGQGAFHHGKKAEALYCLPRNYWWFYRPYTTKQENYARCEPYFHYLEPTNGRRAGPDARYFK